MSALLEEELYLTPEEYLAFEEASPIRHEYINGYVQAMAGADWNHRVVSTNILAELALQLRGKPCIAFGQDARVRIRFPGKSFGYYPDVTVDCSGIQSLETEEPSVIFEVLSPSTRRADFGDKLVNYTSLASMRVYALVEPKRPHLTIHRRHSDGIWKEEAVSGSEATLALPEIECALPLREIYDRIVFAPKH